MTSFAGRPVLVTGRGEGGARMDIAIALIKII
jgi:hypothetical protein